MYLKIACCEAGFILHLHIHPGRAPCKTPPKWACCILCNMGSFHII